MREQLFFEVQQKQANARPINWVTGHQLWVRKTLVDVLIDNVGFVQNEITFNQNGHLPIGIHHGDVLWLIEEVHIADFEIHTLLKQHETAAVGKRAGGARVQNHHDNESLNKKQWRHVWAVSPLQQSRKPIRGALMLLDIFPVCGIQAPRNHGEHRKEQHHPDTDAHTSVLDWLGHPLHESYQVTRRLIKLCR